MAIYHFVVLIDWRIGRNGGGVDYSLPKAQPEMALSGLHISYFLQKCKKGKPDEMDLPLLKKRYHTIFMDVICASL